MSDEAAQTTDEETGDPAGYNASNPKDIKDARKKTVNATARWQALLRGLMSAPEGREFIWMLLSRFCPNRSSFHQNSMTMAMQEGRKIEGNLILEELQRISPRQYVQMLQERLNDQ